MKHFILFHVLTGFPSPQVKQKLDYYHQKVSVLVASSVAVKLKSWDNRKKGNFKKIHEKLGFDRPPKRYILIF